jgi:hypothetical protein
MAYFNITIQLPFSTGGVKITCIKEERTAARCCVLKVGEVGRCMEDHQHATVTVFTGALIVLRQ